MHATRSTHGRQHLGPVRYSATQIPRWSRHDAIFSQSLFVGVAFGRTRLRLRLGRARHDSLSHMHHLPERGSAVRYDMSAAWSEQALELWVAVQRRKLGIAME